MQPAVDPPARLRRGSVDLKLKSHWRFDTARSLFVMGSGRMFVPTGLPRGSRIVYKAPSLAAADAARLSRHERDLQRYVQVILRQGIAGGLPGRNPRLALRGKRLLHAPAQPALGRVGAAATARHPSRGS